MVLNMHDKSLYAVNKKTNEFTKTFIGIENLDGIVDDGNKGYFVSGAWQGQVFHIDADGNKQLILDLGKENTFTADIEYVANERLLIVPTLNKTVLGYKLKK